jgi:hypothetical protein
MMGASHVSGWSSDGAVYYSTWNIGGKPAFTDAAHCGEIGADGHTYGTGWAFSDGAFICNTLYHYYLAGTATWHIAGGDWSAVYIGAGQYSYSGSWMVECSGSYGVVQCPVGGQALTGTCAVQ